MCLHDETKLNSLRKTGYLLLAVALLCTAASDYIPGSFDQRWVHALRGFLLGLAISINLGTVVLAAHQRRRRNTQEP